MPADSAADPRSVEAGSEPADSHTLLALREPPSNVKHTAQCVEIAMLLGAAGFSEDAPIQDAVRALIAEHLALREPPEAQAGQPKDARGRFMLNKYGRECYDLGFEAGRSSLPEGQP